MRPPATKGLKELEPKVHHPHRNKLRRILEQTPFCKNKRGHLGGLDASGGVAFPEVFPSPKRADAKKGVVDATWMPVPARGLPEACQRL